MPEHTVKNEQNRNYMEQYLIGILSVCGGDFNAYFFICRPKCDGE